MKKKTDLLLMGDLVTSLVSTATATLHVAFILSLGNTVYQAVSLGCTIMGILTAFIIQKNPNIVNIGWCKFYLFMRIEAIANLVCGVLTLIYGTPWVAVVASITLAPLASIQKLSINRLTAETYPSSADRTEHDNKLTIYGKYVAVMGGMLAFVLNKTISGAQAFALLCFVDIVNNIFYMRQYMINKNTSTRQAA